MRDLRIPLVVVLGLALTFPMSFTAVAAVSSNTEQAQSTALERGYRTGYSDGYNAGYKDVADGASRDFQSKQEYQRADRSYNSVWGPVEDYHDGYQQGFENGYVTGYDRQPFNSSIPTGFGRKGNPNEIVQTTSQPNPDATDQSGNSAPVSGVPAGIPRDMILTVELLTPISTDVSQRGDPFQARVLQPNQYAGSIVEGRVTNVKRPGKAKGRAELQLSFEKIRLPDNRIASFRADLVEIVQMGNSDGVGQVDPEGVGLACRQIGRCQVEDPLVAAETERDVRHISYAGFIDNVNRATDSAQHGQRGSGRCEHCSWIRNWDA